MWALVYGYRNSKETIEFCKWAYIREIGFVAEHEIMATWGLSPRLITKLVLFFWSKLQSWSALMILVLV